MVTIPDTHKIDRKISNLMASIATEQAKKENILRETTYECAACGQTNAIKDTVFIQTHWYVSPHGCTGGDYWKQGEGQCDCPKCGARLRLYNAPQLTNLKRLFKEVKEEHKR